MVTVNLGIKFTSINFEEVLSEYWDKSFNAKAVTFELSKLEWIAIEQVTFLIGWIDKLREREINVSIKIPGTQDIKSSGIIYKRRKRCLNYLMIDWKLQTLMNNRGVQLLSGGIQTSRNIQIGVPFYGINTIIYEAKKYDSDFDQLYEATLVEFSKYVEKKIKSDTLLNYFDNHFLHYSIIKEFYSNTCQHAYGDKKTGKCFFSIFSNNKIDENKFYGQLLEKKLEARYAERPIEEQVFFKDENDKFINTSFIEFTFMDFGNGIAKTLRPKYFAEEYESIKEKLGELHLNQNEDTRILEYAFLLFTSRYELGKDFEMHDYIPRGLFIIKDIVRRYGGMIIARSGKGKIIFNYNRFQNSNYSLTINYRENDFSDKIGDGFPGTSITIVLPAREFSERSYKRKPKKKQVENTTPQVHFINLLEFTHSVLKDKRIATEPSEIKKKVKFYEEFFRKVCNQLLSYKHETGNLILFDFAGVELSNHDIYYKFLYFLSYCPLISDDLHVCLFNVVEKGINEALTGTEQLTSKSKGFFIKPIPCLYPDLSVNWIGISDTTLENIITSVWKQDERKNRIDSDIHHIEGNIVEIEIAEQNMFSIKIKVQSYYDLLQEICDHHADFIDREIKNEGLNFTDLIYGEHNYNVVLNRKVHKRTGMSRLFLTANGKYQKEFLTFIEKLYRREYRRLIATYFLFNFSYNTENDKIKGLTKVLTVTLSSQLLGKEFADIINEIGCTTYPVKLIPLSNYYDFAAEEPFNEIHETDQIVVVNDVISTGNLSREIIKSVKSRSASILGLITIIDSRTDSDMKQEITTPLIALLARPIQKFDDKELSEEEKIEPIWINPILNAPNTMSREKSNTQSILKSPQEFTAFFSDDSFFKIGYFKLNTVYHTYYLQTDLFLKKEQENGFPILTTIIEAFKDRLTSEKNSSLEFDINEIKRIHARYLEQYEINSSGSKKTKTTRLENAFQRIEQGLTAELANNRQYSLYDTKRNQLVDFIFYPFLSSVSEIEKNINPIALSLKGNHSVEIYPVPRIMTPRGWRFSFPPKFLNFQTKNKSVLIFDDGSCTGETIIQMIDTLSFLELSEINVLSIFARLEDFQIEFLTRIKQIKVKDSSTQNRRYKIIPINIYFGTHFHIPVYTKNTHPYFAELKELDEITNYFDVERNSALPNYLDKYIQMRKDKISFPVSPKVETNQSPFPKGINRRLMFIIRDLIGNYDSYRLYKEDEHDYGDSTNSRSQRESFKNLVEKPEGKLAFIAVLTHESNLIDTVKRVYPEHISSTVEFLREESLNNSTLTGDLDSIYFLLRAISAISLPLFFDRRFMLLILDKIDSLLKDREEHISLYFIGYMFSAIILKKRANSDAQLENGVKLLLQSLLIHVNQKKEFKKKYSNLIGQLYNDLLPDEDESTEGKEIRVLQRVKNYYQRQIVNHKGKKVSSHPNDYLTLSDLIITLQGNFEGNPSEDNKRRFVESLHGFYQKLEKVLLKDLRKALEFLKNFYLKNDLNEPDIPSIIQKIGEFEKLYENSKSDSFLNEKLTEENNPNLAEWLLEFQHKILELESPLPTFITNDNVDLKSCVEQTIKEFKKKKTKELNGADLNIEVDIEDLIRIRMHPYFLRIMVFELIENKRKYALGTQGGFRLKRENNKIQFQYWQKDKFKKDLAESGLTTIRNILRIYSGESVIKANGHYEFRAIFPTNILMEES